MVVRRSEESEDGLEGSFRVGGADKMRADEGVGFG